MAEPIAQQDEAVATGSLARRLSEATLFTCVVAFSCLAIIAVAMAAPFVLAASAIAGLFAKPGAPRGWRSAGA